MRHVLDPDEMRWRPSREVYQLYSSVAAFDWIGVVRPGCIADIYGDEQVSAVRRPEARVNTRWTLDAQI